jgi:hypothetical protein
MSIERGERMMSLYMDELGGPVGPIYGLTNAHHPTHTNLCKSVMTFMFNQKISETYTVVETVLQKQKAMVSAC